MDVCEEIGKVRQLRSRQPGVSWGLVPTMGFLHEGHLSLVRLAHQQNDRVAATIFVNPAQFNDPKDLTAYPRDLERDLEMLERAGVDLVWTPTAATVYPAGYQTYVEVENISRRLEGASRPGHLKGVATVVTKLFNVLQPDRAYFGQKDAQQALVIGRLAADLNFDIEIVVGPTVREADGLAMSSRNANLSAAARPHAACLYKALTAARDAIVQGEGDAERVRARMSAVVAQTPGVTLDYASVADPQSLEEQTRITGRCLLSMAVYLDGVRLIDNLPVACE